MDCEAPLLSAAPTHHSINTPSQSISTHQQLLTQAPSLPTPTHIPGSSGSNPPATDINHRIKNYQPSQKIREQHKSRKHKKRENSSPSSSDNESGGSSDSDSSSSSERSRSEKKHKKHSKKDKHKRSGERKDSRASQDRNRKKKDRDRSRDHKKKDRKHKDGKSKKKHRKSSRERERSREQKKKDKYQDKGKRSQQDWSREKGRERDRSEKDTKRESPKTAAPETGNAEQPRRRQRSRSPRSYYKRNQASSNETEFWDSFTWVPKLNVTGSVSSAALANTRKMRRIQITNLPLQIGLTESDVSELVSKFMMKNYLCDPGNMCPVKQVELYEADRSAALELSSVEQTCRMYKLQKVELIKSNISKIIRLGDSLYGSSIVTQAQTAAQAQAAVFAAMNILQNKSTSFDLRGGVATIVNSTVLRVTNAVTPYMCDHLSEEQWKEHHDDLVEGFSQYGKILHHWFVRKEHKMPGAEPGNLFIQYETREMAEKAVKTMQDRAYDERKIKIYVVPEELYDKHFKPLMPAGVC